MKFKTFFTLAAAYVVLTFAIAATWHLAAFKDIYDALGIFTRKEPIIPLGVASMLIQGAVVAYLFPLLVNADRPIFSGMKIGLVLGVFMGSNAVLAEGGHQEVASLATWIFLEGTYYVVQFVVVGALLGRLLERFNLHSQTGGRMFCPKCKTEYKKGFSRCADCDVDLIPELPPEPEAPEEYVDLINIKTFSSRQDAELAKGLLAANGVNAVVSGDDYGGINPGLAFSSGVRLLVKEEEVVNAKRIFREAGISI
jgi:Putative prokaryotic signal transducing protein